MNFITTLDTYLFLVINHLPHTSLTDFTGVFLSHIGSFGFIWFMIGILYIVLDKKHNFVVAKLLMLAGAISFISTELVFKPWFGRLRPAEELGAIILGVDLSSSYSFPSGHATIGWACAKVLSHKKPQWRFGFYTLAFLISFSRVFIGKHYPLDVIAGGLLGFGIGSIVLRFFRASVDIIGK